MMRFFDAYSLALCLLIVSLPHVAQVVMHWHSLPLGEGIPPGPNDPDPWLRLLLVREWLSGSGWYSHAVPHTNTPFGGISSPWTRPLDLVIATLTQLQPAAVDISLRLMRSALLLPWLWTVLLTLGICRIIRHTAPTATAYFIASLFIFSTPMLCNYFGLMNADHHAPLAVLFIWVLAIILAPRQTARHAVIAGILLALQLWMSVESLILIAAVYGWYGLHWLRGDHGASAPLVPLTVSLCASTTLALAIERPAAAWTLPVYDSLSIVHVAALALAALLALLLRRVQPKRITARLLLAASAVVACCGVLYALYPLFFIGPMAEVDPYILTQFLPNISEARPFYKLHTHTLLSHILAPTLAVLWCTFTWLRPRLAYYHDCEAAARLYFLLISLALYLAQQRWSYYLLPLTVATIAPLFAACWTGQHPAPATRALFQTISRIAPKRQWCLRIPPLMALLICQYGLLALPALSAPLAHHLWPQWQAALALEKKALTDRETCGEVARYLLRSGEFNALLPGVDPHHILAPTDIGSEIGFFTPHYIVASNYHREGGGIRYVWEALRERDADHLRAHLYTRGITVLLLCPNHITATEGIVGQLLAGTKTPPWLKEIHYSLPDHLLHTIVQHRHSAAFLPQIFLVEKP